VILFAFAFGWKGALASLILGVALVAYCLMQPDPLLPVAHVEGILLLACSQSQVLGIAMAAGLGLAAVSPILLPRSADVRWRAFALSAYFGATSLAPLFGTYPVPLAGYGLSFVIGWVLGFAALATRRQANSLTSG
jgi:MFS family permease